MEQWIHNWQMTLTIRTKPFKYDALSLCLKQHGRSTANPTLLRAAHLLRLHQTIERRSQGTYWLWQRYQQLFGELTERTNYASFQERHSGVIFPSKETESCED